MPLDWSKAKKRRPTDAYDQDVLLRVAGAPPKASPDLNRERDRQAADDAVAAFLARGGQVKKLAPQQAPEPTHRGKGLRKWRKGER